MPLVLLFAAIGVIGFLMVTGWRRRWDPTPEELPPRTLRSVREESQAPALPRWYWPVAIGTYALFLVTLLLTYVTGRSEIASVGLVLFGVSWAARQTAILWTTADTNLRRTAAVLRPLTLLFGIILAATLGWPWWLLVGATLYIGILPVTDLFDRRQKERAGAPSPPRER